MFQAVVVAIETEYFEAAFLADPWPALRDEHRDRYSRADTAEDREAVSASLLKAIGVSVAVSSILFVSVALLSAVWVPREQKTGETK